LFPAEQGVVEITTGGEAGTSLYLTTGQVVGRSALLSMLPEPRTESARAVTRCLLLQVKRADLLKMFADDREMMLDYELSMVRWGGGVCGN
jgi:CRP-like cAMP-binding protein